MFVDHVSVAPEEEVRSPGARVKGSCKLPFEPKPSTRTNAIAAEQPLQPVTLTDWHSHLFLHGKPALPSGPSPGLWRQSYTLSHFSSAIFKPKPTFLGSPPYNYLVFIKSLMTFHKTSYDWFCLLKSPPLQWHWITVPWDGNNGLIAVSPPKLNLPMTLKNITAFFPTAFSYGVLYGVLPKYFSKVRLISSSCYLFLLSAYQNHTHS